MFFLSNSFLESIPPRIFFLPSIIRNKIAKLREGKEEEEEEKTKTNE